MAYSIAHTVNVCCSQRVLRKTWTHARKSKRMFSLLNHFLGQIQLGLAGMEQVLLVRRMSLVQVKGSWMLRKQSSHGVERFRSIMFERKNPETFELIFLEKKQTQNDFSAHLSPYSRTSVLVSQSCQNKAPRPHGLDLLPHSSGGQKSDIKLLAGSGYI